MSAVILGLASTASARDAMVTFRVRVPSETPPDAKVYITGEMDVLGPWDPGKIALGKIAHRTYAITLVLPVGTSLTYKLTRGTWETVEQGRDFEDIADRHLTVVGDQTVPVEVESWRDFGMDTGFHTVVGPFRLHLDFVSAKLGNSRTIVVYLPPGYDSEDEDVRHPVLYMHDGQNLFDAGQSRMGVEWNVDETVNRMVQAGYVEPVIVVGVYNTSDRIFEYTPQADSERGGGGANLYADFIVKELKPYIDSRYRTLPDREHTGVMGASYGGLVSLYLGWTYPRVFSRVGAMSPKYDWADDDIVRYLERNTPPSGVRLWLDMGTAEKSDDRNHDGVPDVLERHRRVRDALMSQGLELGRRFRYLEDEGAVGNERAWASRFPQALEFLFPARRN